MSRVTRYSALPVATPRPPLSGAMRFDIPGSDHSWLAGRAWCPGSIVTILLDSGPADVFSWFEGAVAIVAGTSGAAPVSGRGPLLTSRAIPLPFFATFLPSGR